MFMHVQNNQNVHLLRRQDCMTCLYFTKHTQSLYQHFKKRQIHFLQPAHKIAPIKNDQTDRLIQLQDAIKSF